MLIVIFIVISNHFDFDWILIGKNELKTNF